jgi:hypothetical protein
MGSALYALSALEVAIGSAARLENVRPPLQGGHRAQWVDIAMIVTRKRVPGQAVTDYFQTLGPAAILLAPSNIAVYDLALGQCDTLQWFWAGSHSFPPLFHPWGPGVSCEATRR